MAAVKATEVVRAGEFETHGKHKAHEAREQPKGLLVLNRYGQHWCERAWDDIVTDLATASNSTN